MGRPFGHGVSNIKQVSELFGLIDYMIGLNYKAFSFLDIGCGKGLYGSLMRMVYGWNIQLVGIDLGSFKRFDKLNNEIYNEIYKIDVVDYILRKRCFNQKFDIILGQQIFEHLREKDALKCLDKLKLYGKVIIVGFPKPKKNNDYKDINNLANHKWGCSNKKLNSVDYRRVNKIKNNHVYIWMENPRGEKWWEIDAYLS